MAVSAELSSTFAIFVVPSNAVETTIINPGRAFKADAAAPALTVTLKTSIGGVDTTIVNAETIANNSSSLLEMIAPPAPSRGWELGGNDNLKITFSTFAVGTTATILCVAGGGGTSLSAVE